MKLEDRSQEETERQRRCARSKAWNLAKNIFNLREKDKATIYLPAVEWVLRAAGTKEPEERELVVDSGASMHMVSKKDSAELETMRISKNPTTVMTANDEVQTRDEATVYVKELDLFVTVMHLEETPAVLSLGKLCEDHGYTYHWTSGQKPHLTNSGKRINCKKANYLPFVVPGLSTSSSASSSPASSTSSSQDTVISTENPATDSSETRVDQQKPKTQIKMKTTKNYEVNVQPHQYSSSSSHESSMEPRAKVVLGPGKHGIFSHFPKDWKL